MRTRHFGMVVLALILTLVSKEDKGWSAAGHPSGPSRNPAPVKEEVEVYGRSFRGRPLMAVVLGNGPNVTMVLGGIHGNEPAPPGVVERLRDYLVRHPQEWNSCEIVLVPRANPDGLLAGTRTNARGVDLNRNFPAEWKPRRRGVRYSTGAGPASEPETRALIRLLARYHPSKLVSIHQPLNCLNWGGEWGLLLARTMQRWNGYRIRDELGYPTPGSFGKYCGRKLGISVVTLELPRGADSTAWNQNQQALLAVITLALPQKDGGVVHEGKQPMRTTVPPTPRG